MDNDAKTDLFNILDAVPDGFDTVRLAVVQGRIDGVFANESAHCGCVKQHLAFYRNVDVRCLPSVAKLAYPMRSALECELYSVQPGHKPENNRILKNVLEWLDEWRSQQFEF